ncbi:MAG: arylsulfatase [Planctomycetales bacterium]
MQCNNPARGKIPTPWIDSLAQTGMRFTDAHSSSSVCTPTRYALLTGRYNWRSPLQKNVLYTFGGPLIKPDRLTLPAYLKRQGYRTACFGKWHLGLDWACSSEEEKLAKEFPKTPGTPPRPEQIALWQRMFSGKIGRGPTTLGFDQFFGVDLPNFPPFCYLENDHTVGIPSTFLAAHLVGNNQASVQGPALPGWTLEPTLPAITDRACRYIQDSAAAKQPFFLYLPLTTPHTPLAVNKEWKGKSGLNDFADLVMETDAVVGRVLKSLKAAGVEDNTLLLFTSDNGCAHYIGIKDLEAKGHFPSGPLRGYKSDIWEGGHRIPFLIRWPGVVPAGSVCHQLVLQADLFATLADFFGEKLPDNAAEDSISFLPILKGHIDITTREFAVNHSIQGMFALRQGPWKLIFGQGSGGWTKGQDNEPMQLYNLAEDLAERKNRAADQPERVKAMTAQMEKFVTTGRSTPGKPQPNDVPITWKPAGNPPGK